MTGSRVRQEEINALADHQPPEIVPGGGGDARASSNQTVGADDVDAKLGFPAAAPPVNNLPDLNLPAIHDDADSTLISSRSSKPAKRRQDEAGTSAADKRKMKRGRRLINRGVRGVFLYRKKLEDSDVSRALNRLFVTKAEKLMEFLSMEEAAVVEGRGWGLKIEGIDGESYEYENLRLRKWMGLTVINGSGWKEMVADNNAVEGDEIEIWGYRHNQEPLFAFHFKREN